MCKKQNSYIIYVCGGVGSGKSTVLGILKEKYGARVIETDKLAHEMLKKGNVGYDAYVNLLGNEIVSETGELDREKIAEKIFREKDLLAKINSVLHPLVWEQVESEIKIFREKFKDSSQTKLPILVIESALLPANKSLKEFLDYAIYLYSSTELRVERLKKSRGYSDEKIHSIMSKQPSYEEYLEFSDVVIENGEDLEKVEQRLDIILQAVRIHE